MNNNSVSIVIPAWNEAANLPELLSRITASLKKSDWNFEIILVDDHSTDETQKISESLQNRFPHKYLYNLSLKGKSYSIIFGVENSLYSNILMIDADLQYPPEAISDFLKAFTKNSIVVGERSYSKQSFLRQTASRINKYMLGFFLLGLKCDTQSGMKMFHKEIIFHLDRRLVKPWSLDMPLLITAKELGYKFKSIKVPFERRKNGTSKINILKATFEVLYTAVRLKLKFNSVHYLPPTNENSMLGAGISFNFKKFITHTTLSQEHSAIKTFSFLQKLFLTSLGLIVVIGLILNIKQTLIVVMAILTVIYFLDVFFNFFLIIKSLHSPPEITFDKNELEQLKDSNLPIYSILCPLYKEAQVLPQFVSAMQKLSWPKEKLDVILLLEEDDPETISEIKKIPLPDYFKTVIVPHTQPKTKPKACNYGLSFAKGELIVVYDAEDIPDPMQLKKAFLAFSTQPKNIFCLQSKLNYYNHGHNLLTRLFTAEYSLWFDIILPGLQSINTFIPLGGTSNHFRTEDLKKLKGWDPFNVAEDCDLGTRLFKLGYKTAIIDSTTMEEANSNILNWFRQRSRWIKGYLQTYFVHTRSYLGFFKKHKTNALIFQLVVGGKIAFMLINPILWATTLIYFIFYQHSAAFIESLFPSVVYYMAVFSLIFGNFLYLYYYMIGAAKKEQWYLLKYIFLVPFYWLGVSLGAVIAIIQLVFKPHYWEKTIHGYHLKKESVKYTQKNSFGTKTTYAYRFAQFATRAHKNFLGPSILILSNFVASLCNFFYNSFLGRTLSIEEFGLINLIGNFIYLTHIPVSALIATVTYKTAYLLGKYETPIKSFWQHTRSKTIKFSLILGGIWLIASPFLEKFFNSHTIIPFILFTPVWTIGLLSAVDSGFLSGNLKFSVLAVVNVTDALAKLLIVYILVGLNLTDWVYTALPLSMLCSFSIAYIYAKSIKEKDKFVYVKEKINAFPLRFFNSYVLIKLSGIAFLSLDTILAKHFLSPKEAGNYAFLSLVGKMIYFLGSTFSGFMIPFVSKNEGSGENSKNLFNKLVLATAFFSVSAFIVFGVLGNITVPFLWGNKSLEIINYLPLYACAIVFYTVTSDFVTFNQVKKRLLFPVLSIFMALIEVVGLIFFHDSISTFVLTILITSVMYFFAVLSLHLLYSPLVDLFRNLLDFIDLFGFIPQPKTADREKLRILIFNWRDIKHIWSGGAEVYLHELAKRWSKMGHHVTIFCGNDGKSLRHEEIDGIDIVRRGGFYFVYLWAFLYYVFRFRGKYDVIIDSENGIPFFTPLYATEKKVLLIHHVHQEVFRKSLKAPLSWIALFLELKVMPLVYRRTKIITVSPSSKTEILLHHITKKDPQIIYNGVDLSKYKLGEKSKTPLILYLGRLKFYKSLNIFIQSAKEILQKIPDVEFVIAGNGEEKSNLIKLAKNLGINEKIQFLGNVTEEEKVRLYQKAWLFVNPSLMEGWGITTIEANACGTPVVASNVPGLRDSIHNPHNGLLVPYGNVEEFSNAVVSLVRNNSLRKKMSKEAVDWAKKFDWDKSAQEFIKII